MLISYSKVLILGELTNHSKTCLVKHLILFKMMPYLYLSFPLLQQPLDYCDLIFDTVESPDFNGTLIHDDLTPIQCQRLFRSMKNTECCSNLTSAIT